MLTTIVKGICELCHRYVLQVKKDRSTASSLGLPVGVHSAWGGKTEGAGGGGGGDWGLAAKKAAILGNFLCAAGGGLPRV